MSDSSIDPFWGAASLREAALAHEVKGNLVAARHRWVTTHFGPDVLQDLAGRLTGQAHTWLLEPPLTIRWCPMAILAEIDEVIVAGPMKGDVAQMRPFGSEIADYDLSTLYRVLFRLGSPGFVLRNMNTAYRSYIRPGVLTIKVDGKGVVDLVLNDTVLPLYYCGHGILGWIDAAVVKSGGKHVLVEHDRCRHRGQHVCGWSVQWQ